MRQKAILLALAVGGFTGAAERASAIPAFAVQTGQPCSSCHVGGFGPQLTPFGRDFKLNGYTQRAVVNLPISAMALASWTHTSKDQATAPTHFAPNDNLAIDQVAIFVAGGVGSHFGGFAQTTYSGTADAFHWDNLDLRAVTHANLGKSDLLFGVTVNNAPGVQDAWNTLPAWGFPYVASALAQSPTAAPIFAGHLAQSAIGASGYVRWNSMLYAELGAYVSPDQRFLQAMGVSGADEIHNAAPYGRLAFTKELTDRQNIEIGAFGLSADLYPGFDKSAGTTDKYTDLGVDGSYQFLGDNGRAVTVNARYTHEKSNLDASFILGGPAQTGHSLDDVRADIAYHSPQGWTTTLEGFETSGTKDVGLYASPNGSPNSSGLIAQADYTFYPNGASPMGPRFNARVGLQFTHYLRFDGATKNVDATPGQTASDNDTLWAFIWMAY